MDHSRSIEVGRIEPNMVMPEMRGRAVRNTVESRTDTLLTDMSNEQFLLTVAENYIKNVLDGGWNAVVWSSKDVSICDSQISKFWTYIHSDGNRFYVTDAILCDGDINGSMELNVNREFFVNHSRHIADAFSNSGRRIVVHQLFFFSKNTVEELKTSVNVRKVMKGTV